MLRLTRLLAVAASMWTLAGCGGSGGSSGGGPQVNLSSDQRIFESVNLTGGDYSLAWNIPFGGGNFVAGTNFVVAPYESVLPASPSTAGAQRQDPLLLNVGPGLISGSSTSIRVITGNGFQIVSGSRLVSYEAGTITVGYLSEGGSGTVLQEQQHDFVAATLAGFMDNSPEELLAEYPVQDWIKFNNFSATIQWLPGSAYIKRQRTRIGDTLFALDCANAINPATTTTPTPNACIVNGSMATLFPITLYAGNRPFEFSQAADGTQTTVQGLTAWIANAPIPLDSSATRAYRAYFEYNGNVYMGALEKAGTAINIRQSDGSAVDYTLNFNLAAIQSLQQGLITGSTVPGSQVGSTEEVPSLDLFGIGGHGVNGTLSPADLRSHYDLPATLTGAGQTVAIVDAPGSGDPADDLDIFSAFYGLPACNAATSCFQRVDLSNGAPVPTTDDWGSEVALDTQMVHSIAPGAKIVLVTAASSSGPDLVNAINTAAALPGVTAVTMSFGVSPFEIDRNAEDALLAGFQANGLVFFASSGDSGSLRQAFTHYPALSAYVTAVGGTQILAVAPAAGAPSEVGWQFGGGGSAVQTPMPAWQSAYLSALSYGDNIGMRAVPDVAAVADFQHSAFGIYFKDGWRMGGGTSAAAPLWAGVAAVLAEYLANKHASLAALVSSTPGGFNGVLYQMRLTQGPKPAFVDITVGSNNLSGNSCSVCAAATGYDDVTGLGVPDVTALFSYL